MFGSAFNIQSAFWLLAGIFTGVGGAILLQQLWRSDDRALGHKRRIFISVAGIALFATAALTLYGFLGRPDLVGIPNVATHPTSNADANGQSMETVTATLAERLARDGGTDEEWQLLAQSFDFMGRAEEAQRAREHVVASPPSSKESSAESQALIAQARQLRVDRKYGEARAAYESAIAQSAMNADAWADYADVLASLNAGKLGKGSAQAIDRALSLEPNHAKALWLKASLAHDEHRYGDALVIWKQLRRVVANSESDARIIDANIEEAEQLAATSPSEQTTAVMGTVDIDPALSARVKPGAILFVYAKSPEAKGPPLAVWKTTVGKWPITFKLDDSMSMMPTLKLSSAVEVIVEARISLSGQANATAGDLQAPGARIKPREGKAIRLRIDREVG